MLKFFHEDGVRVVLMKNPSPRSILFIPQLAATRRAEGFIKRPQMSSEV
jgi:hypothetical protein